MEKQVYTLFNKVRQNWCDSCDGNCQECVVSELLEDIKHLDVEVAESNSGCAYCWDEKRKKNKELFFLDSANNMRICECCPACGRKY